MILSEESRRERDKKIEQDGMSKVFELDLTALDNAINLGDARTMCSAKAKPPQVHYCRSRLVQMKGSPLLMK